MKLKWLQSSGAVELGKLSLADTSTLKCFQPVTNDDLPHLHELRLPLCPDSSLQYADFCIGQLSED